MSEKTITDLRAALFEAIDGVKNGTLSVEKARMISDLSQVIVNTAKTEVEFIKATDGRESKFLGAMPDSGAAMERPALPKGITGTYVHKIK